MTRSRFRMRAWVDVRGAPVAVLIFVVAALAGMVLLSFVDVQGGTPKFDGDFYRRMAEHPRTFYDAPFSYRVLTPMLVWVLPFATRTGFALATVLGVAGTATILFHYVRTFDDQAAGLRALVFFALTGGVLFVFVDPWLVDPLAMLLSMLTFLLVRRGHIGWASLTACAAVASHENALVMLMPLAVAHFVERGRRFDPRLVAFVGLPIVVYVLLRRTPLLYGYIPPSVPFRSPDYLRDQFDLRLTIDGGLGNSVLFAIAGSFGATWVLAALGLRGAPRFLRLTALMVPLVLILPVVAADWDRLLTTAFPVVLPLAARVRLRWWILVPFVAVQAVLAGLTVERLSTIYRDIFFAFPTGHFEDRNTTLTLVLLGVAVVLALAGAATSRTWRAPRPRPAAGIRGASA
jgi:hypothetical protein